MTQRELMMLVAEAVRIESFGEWGRVSYLQSLKDVDISAIVDLILVEHEGWDGNGEPVAWMFVDDEEHGYIGFRRDPPTAEQIAYLKKWNRPAWTPLYAAPNEGWNGHISTEDEADQLHIAYMSGIEYGKKIAKEDK